MDRNRRVIGIDLGGTFGRGIRGALVDGAGTEIARKEAVTPRTSQEELIRLPRVAVGGLGGDAALLGAAAVAFERGGVGDAVRAWRETNR